MKLQEKLLLVNGVLVMIERKNLLLQDIIIK
jgi:hypothetical protein